MNGLHAIHRVVAENDQTIGIEYQCSGTEGNRNRGAVQRGYGQGVNIEGIYCIGDGESGYPEGIARAVIEQLKCFAAAGT